MFTGTPIGVALVAALILWLMVVIRRAVQRRDLDLEISETVKACQTVRTLVAHSKVCNKQPLFDHVSTAETHLSTAARALAAGNRAEAIRLLDLSVSELRAARGAVQGDEVEDDGVGQDNI